MAEVGGPPLRRSLRARLTATATVAVAAVLATTGWGLVAAQGRTLTAAVDQVLEQRAEDLAAQIASDDLPEALGQTSEGESVAQVVGADGAVIAASPSLGGAAALGPAPSGARDVVVTSADLPSDDDTFRLLSRRVDGPDGAVVVHVATTYDDVLDAVDALRTSLLVAVPLVTVLLGALVWWLTGRALRPVEAIRVEVEEISGTDVHRRVPVSGRGDEVAELAVTMNRMLARIEDANERQQRFIADASHELRSPLTRMRAELEVDVAHPATADPEATHRSVLAETVAMQALVDDLLQLARSSAGASTGSSAAIDLDDLVLAEVDRVRASTAAAVDASRVDPVEVPGDAGALRRLIRNLLENATRHARTTVHVSCGVERDCALVIVEDDGAGVPAADRDRVFERFARLDDARHRDAGGTGLGLSIVADVAEQHGGSVRIGDGDLGGARFEVRLPR